MKRSFESIYENAHGHSGVVGCCSAQKLVVLKVCEVKILDPSRIIVVQNTSLEEKKQVF